MFSEFHSKDITSTLIGITILLAISCNPIKDKAPAPAHFSHLDTINTIKHFVGDSLRFALRKDEVEDPKFKQVDSLFYYTYLSHDSNFQGLNYSHAKIGGPDCYLYYYGVIRNRIPGFFQVLILQVFQFNDVANDLFLLTFNERDSLISTLPVASLIYQAEIEPIVSSVMYKNNQVVLKEMTINHIPDNLVPLTLEDGSQSWVPDSTKLRYCTDIITKRFRFLKGDYILLARDSTSNCYWEDI
ncbi:MAG: hypothetical protein HOP30_09110 [Cyclobacteriaceae bacterium]|nr:hypothetical protein [Cyclobacteriaceae bacterium]